MTELIGTIIRSPQPQKDIDLVLDKDPNESYETQLQMKQKVSIQRGIYVDAFNQIGETIDDIDKGVERRDEKTNFLAAEKGTSYEENRKEMKKKTNITENSIKKQIE